MLSRKCFLYVVFKVMSSMLWEMFSSSEARLAGNSKRVQKDW